MQSRVAVLMGENELLLEGLRRILIGADFYVAATASSIDDVLTSPLASDLPILLIFNIGSDQKAVLTEVKRFKEQRPAALIFLLADHNQLSDDNIVIAFRYGAKAYFLKPTYDTLMKSLELVMAGEAILPAAALSLILRQEGLAPACDPEKIEPALHTEIVTPVLHTEIVTTARAVENSEPVRGAPIECAEASGTYSPRLSAQEQCILRCLIEGDSNKIIARKHEIAEATVKVHVKAILRKIRLNNRTQAAIWGISHGALINGVSNVNGATTNGSAAGAAIAIPPYRRPATN